MGPLSSVMKADVLGDRSLCKSHTPNPPPPTSPRLTGSGAFDAKALAEGGGGGRGGGGSMGDFNVKCQVDTFHRVIDSVVDTNLKSPKEKSTLSCAVLHFLTRANSQ